MIAAWKRQAKESLPDAVECGSFVRPCRGERVSGDAGVVSHRGGLSLVAIVDALGDALDGDSQAVANQQDLVDVHRGILGRLVVDLAARYY